MTSEPSPGSLPVHFWRWLRATRHERNGVISFGCHPWPGAYFSLGIAGVAAVATASIGIAELLAAGWFDGAFFLGLSLLLPCVVILARDELRLDGAAISRPRGKYTLRIPFEDLTSIGIRDEGRLTIGYRGQSWFGGRPGVQHERARLLDIDGFVQEALTQIERRCGADFAAMLRRPSSD